MSVIVPSPKSADLASFSMMANFSRSATSIFSSGVEKVTGNCPKSSSTVLLSPPMISSSLAAEYSASSKPNQRSPKQI